MWAWVVVVVVVVVVLLLLLLLVLLVFFLFLGWGGTCIANSTLLLTPHLQTRNRLHWEEPAARGCPLSRATQRMRGP